MIIDRRKEFENGLWRQGYVMITQRTERWSAKELSNTNKFEKRCAFANFSTRDQGRGRTLVYRYSTENECLKAIDEHNEGLNNLEKK